MYLPNYGCESSDLNFGDLVTLTCEGKLTDVEVLACVHEWLDFSENPEDIFEHIMEVLNIAGLPKIVRKNIINDITEKIKERDFDSAKDIVANIVQGLLDIEEIKKAA